LRLGMAGRRRCLYSFMVIFSHGPSGRHALPAALEKSIVSACGRRD
jgi:hypothetical protein